MTVSSIADLILAARKGRSQKAFALELGIEQSTVSRYESGKTNPPARVIEHCMRIVHTSEQIEPPTAEDLAERVRECLADPELEQVRLALSKLIDVLVNERAQTRGAIAALR
jgi:transcriptional regulator with XRE-family HTH domain